MTVDVAGRVLPMNEFVYGLHGPTDSITKTMRELAYFPQVATPDDAVVLDLHASVSLAGSPRGRAGSSADEPYSLSPQADASRGGSTASFSVRFATGLRRNELLDWFASDLGERSVVAANPDASVGESSVSALLSDEHQTRLNVMIDDFPGYRSVRVVADYTGFDHGPLFERFGDWHNGTAPVSPSTRQSGIEINTFACGVGPSALVLYSTHYCCSGTSRDDQRAVVDSHIQARGWTYHEPRDGILFIRDGEFDAETHLEGDHRSSSVTFVGEFQLH
jgi:hypothetical protein